MKNENKVIIGFEFPSETLVNKFADLYEKSTDQMSDVALGPIHWMIKKINDRYYFLIIQNETELNPTLLN